MSYRSWLKDVKSIHALGSHLHALDQTAPNFDKRDLAYENKWRDRDQNDLAVAPEYRAYFGARMHDNFMHSITRQGSELTMSLHSWQGHTFATALSEILDIDEPKEFWRVDLHCHDVGYANGVHAVEGGELRWTDWQTFRPLDDLTQADTFLTDWFFQQDDRVQWIAQLWVWREKPKEFEVVYVLVDCASLTVHDWIPELIAKAFTPVAASLWNDAWQGVSSQEWVWSGEGIYGYLLRRIEERGIDLQSLKPQT